MFIFQVCAALRKMTSVLRLGIYREHIEKYRAAGSNQRPAAVAIKAEPVAEETAATSTAVVQPRASPMSTDPPTTATPSSSTCSPGTTSGSSPAGGPAANRAAAVASGNNKVLIILAGFIFWKL